VNLDIKTKCLIMIICFGIFSLAHVSGQSRGMSHPTVNNHASPPPTYQVKLLYPLSGEADINAWLEKNPGWWVVAISDMDYGAPHVWVEREVTK